MSNDNDIIKKENERLLKAIEKILELGFYDFRVSDNFIIIKEDIINKYDLKELMKNFYFYFANNRIRIDTNQNP